MHLNSLTKKVVFFVFSACFLLAAVWFHLPEDRLGLLIKKQINGQLKGQAKITFSTLETQWNGIKLNHLTIAIPRQDLNAEMKSFSLTPLSPSLFKGEISFSGEFLAGTLNGSYSILKNTIYLEGSRIDFNRYPLVRTTDLFSLPLEVQFQANANLEQQTGRLQIKTETIALSGKSPLLVIAALPESTQFETLQADLRLEAGKKLIVNSYFKGDISGKLTGNIQINQRRPLISKMDMKLEADARSAYQQKVPLLEQFFKLYKGRNHDISIQITGSFNRPNIKKWP